MARLTCDWLGAHVICVLQQFVIASKLLALN